MNGNPFSLSLNQPYVSRSISAENFTGAKGSGGMATDGCTADAALQDDISSVAFWYQMAPATQMHPLPKAEDLVII